jgi:hypothetical protein
MDKAGYPKTNPFAKFHKKPTPSLPVATEAQSEIMPVNSISP